MLKEIDLCSRRQKVELFLVGGALRDALLGRIRQHPDFDFCLKRGAIAFARRLHRRLHGGFVVLDKEHGACRIVKQAKEKTYTFDFTDFRGADLKDDLLHRDFTINALALPLQEALSSRRPLTRLIDPHGAVGDLRAKVIRMCCPSAFNEDPLRIARAFTFSCACGFRIEPRTLKAIRREKGKLATVSPERIRDELFKILDQPQSSACLQTLDTLGILTVIIPEIELMRGVRQGPYHHLDVWRHSMETLRQLELLLQPMRRNSFLSSYLDEALCSQRRRRALLKLGALLHDIGKPKAKRRHKGKTKFYGHERIGMRITGEIGRRLKLSNGELQALRQMVFWHLRPGYLADNVVITPRAEFRYFRDTGREALSVLLLARADQRATRGRLTTAASRMRHEQTVSGLIRRYQTQSKQKPLPRLVNGDDLLKEFKLNPSPLIGKLLRQLKEQQAIGRIKTKREALAFARKLL